jgi:hypothetical protein
MSAENQLHVVDRGNHSLEVTKTALAARGVTQAEIDEEVLETIARFLAR